MEIDDSQVKKLEEAVNYLQKYIQKQEKLLLDHIRKNLEYEIKIEGLVHSVNDFSGKYEESQKQVEIQNDMMKQAANGVEAVTLEKKKLENTIKNLEQMLSNKKNEYDNLNKSIMDKRNEWDSCNEERANLISELKQLKEEYKRQTEELNILFKENEELKKGKPKIKESPKSVEEF
jgi:chromosome segregation ATPase